jgi:glycosyltransferase involved in cell wall biosynthesis
MRDNALASALKRLGHDVTLVPLYTPLRTENHSDSIPEVFYGGVNVYLQHLTALFRHTPRMLDWVFDRPWLLNLAGRMGSQTRPEKLADLTLDIIKGEEGAAQKELRRLVHYLKTDGKPDVISLPNLMFIGMARQFRRELHVPVICELTGEDIFLDAMDAADRMRLREVIRERAGDVSRFVATSDYYADHMAEYLGIPRERIDVVHTGIAVEYLASPPAPALRPPTVGYLARICPEKGFHRVLEAMAKLVSLPGMSDARLKIAGYVGGRDEKWAKDLLRGLTATPLGKAVTFLGEVGRKEKLAMLDSIDVFSVPTVYPESKGVYVLEAMARGVPVVQPNHGSFPELIRLTGGGVLTPPGDAAALAEALAELLRDEPGRREMGRNGRAGVERMFTDTHMAEGMLAVFKKAAREAASGVMEDR